MPRSRRHGFRRSAPHPALAQDEVVVTDSGDRVPADWYEFVKWAAAETERLLARDTASGDAWVRWCQLYRGPLDDPRCRQRFRASQGESCPDA